MEVRRRNHPLYSKHAASSSSSSGSDKQRIQEEVGEVSESAAVQQIDHGTVSGAAAVDDQLLDQQQQQAPQAEYSTALEEFQKIFGGQPLNLFDELEVNQEEAKTGEVALPLGGPAPDEAKGGASGSAERRAAEAEGLVDATGRPLSQKELEELKALQSVDQELRASGDSSASFELQKGPDGKQYAVAVLAQQAQAQELQQREAAELKARPLVRREVSAKPWKEQGPGGNGRRLPY